MTSPPHALDTELCDSIQLLPELDRDNQRLFANGLLWCYGFHQEEARLHFNRLIEMEPDCALAYWGIAYSHAPFYNRPWDWFTREQKTATARLGYDAVKQGLNRLARSSDVKPGEHAARLLESQLLTNLSLLFRQPEPVDDQTFKSWQVIYAEAMYKLADTYSDHPDVITLIAEALMNCTPWRLWDIKGGTPAQGSRVTDAVTLLEAAMKKSTDNHHHVGLLHMHIHALEMSPYPQRAAGSANRIREHGRSGKKIPPHLPHMASHIDVLTGHYRDAIETNINAVNLDDQVKIVPDEFYQISRLHNIHLQLTAAMMAGRHKQTTQAIQKIENLATTTDEHMHDDWLRLSIEGFYANRLHAYIRFGEWNLLTRHDTLEIDNTYARMPFAQCMMTYARAVAHANTKNLDKAQHGLVQLQRLIARVPDGYVINNNPAKCILAVATAMLEGEWRYHSGDFAAGLDKLREAVSVCDVLDYCEPWPWMHPPRHALGALLLEQQQIDEATTVYETDLGLNDRLPRCLQHPDNLWSLTGLAECYKTAGNQQGLNNIKDALTQAANYADINIQSSCFCRQLHS